MPKLGMKPIRRFETINATLECIYEYGISNTSLDMVATKAGFSKGIITYYFKSRKNLILESLKSFLEAYNLKIGASIKADALPLDKLKAVVKVAFLPLSDKCHETINVSTLNGMENIRLSQKQILKIFIQFISMAANDDELKNIMCKNYANDVGSISLMIQNAKKTYPVNELDDKNSAYAILAIIYGLSFFRVNDFIPWDDVDNRNVAFDFINRVFGISV